MQGQPVGKSMRAAIYSRLKLQKMRIESVGATGSDPVSNRMKTALVRKVIQISTMVHPEKDWAFIALCDDGSLWLYHGSWSQIENIPQPTAAY
jgi:hypothetical protein